MCFLITSYYLGPPNVKGPPPNRVLKLNIEMLLMLLLKPAGYAISFVSCLILLKRLLLFIVKTSAILYLLPIQFKINEQNISRLIYILFENKLLWVKFGSCMFHPRLNMWIFLLKSCLIRITINSPPTMFTSITT